MDGNPPEELTIEDAIPLQAHRMLLFPGRPTNVLDERDCPDADEKFVRHVFYGNTAEKRGLDVFDAIALEILDEIAHFPNLAIPRMPFGRNRYAAVGYLHSLSRLPRSPIHVYRCFYSHWADGRRAIEDGEGKTIGSSIPYRKPSVLVFRVHYYPLTENIWRAAAKAINLLLAPKKPLEFHSPPGADESELVSELAGDAQDPQQFGGGKIVFFQDRVELCGVDICSGPRCQSKRQILDCLRKKLSDGSFIQYSSVPFATEANMDRGQTGAPGAIRDMRNGIVNVMKNKANLKCGRYDVILSGRLGYRLSQKHKCPRRQ